jgi:hypothetical protein
VNRQESRAETPSSRRSSAARRTQRRDQYPFVGLKARHVIARVEGPGYRSHSFFRGLKGRNNGPLSPSYLVHLSRPYRAKIFPARCFPGASPQAITLRAFNPLAITPRHRLAHQSSWTPHESSGRTSTPGIRAHPCSSVFSVKRSFGKDPAKARRNDGQPNTSPPSPLRGKLPVRVCCTQQSFSGVWGLPIAR